MEHLINIPNMQDFSVESSVPTYTDITEGTEKYMPQLFKRKYTPINFAYLTRIWTMDKKFQLPDNSVVHLCDSLFYPELYTNHPDMFDPYQYPFIKQETYIKWLYTNTNIVPEGPLSVHYESKYIYRTVKLLMNQLSFKSKFKNLFKYALEFEMLPLKRNILTICNHNPLTRLFLYGKLPHYRKTVHILSAIFNFILTYPHVDKNHYLHIPWTNTVFTKESFIPSKKNIHMGTIKQPNNTHWIFLMHYLNYLDILTDKSIFTPLHSVEPEKLERINLLVTLFNPTQNHYSFFIHNLKSITEWNVRNRIYIKIYKQFTGLSYTNISIEQANQYLNSTTDESEESSIDNTPTVTVIDTGIQPIIKDHEKVSVVEDQQEKSSTKDIKTTSIEEPLPELSIHVTKSKIQAIEKQTRYAYFIIQEDIVNTVKKQGYDARRTGILLYHPDYMVTEKDTELYKNSLARVVVDLKRLNPNRYEVPDRESLMTPEEYFYNYHKIKYVDIIRPSSIVKIESIEDAHPPFNSRKTQKLISTPFQQTVSAVTHRTSPTQKPVLPDEIPYHPTYNDIERHLPVISKQIEVTDTDIQTYLGKKYTVENTSPIQKQYVHTLKIAEENIVKRMGTVTQPQLNRIRKYLTSMTELSINGMTIEQHLQNTHYLGLKNENLEDTNINIPDKSMLSSKLPSYSEIYKDKMLYTDTALVLTHMSTVGFIPIKVQEKNTINELTKAKTITVQFYDIVNDKKSSVTFTFPLIDKNGICTINGVPKKLKKQLVNIPIVKLSDTRVSLISNYNKTIVERSVYKNYNFATTVYDLIEKGYSLNLLDRQFGTVFDRTKPLPYEYSCIAQRYSSISLKRQPTLPYSTELVFDYANRYSLLNIPTDLQHQVEELEKKYGVLVGTIPELNIGIFISTQNILRYVHIKQQQVYIGKYPPTLLEYFNQYFPDGITSTVPEWVNLKILDKNFPLIFILGYRYGLLHMLEYTRTQFKILDKRTKKILFTEKTLSQVKKSKVQYTPPKMPNIPKTDPHYPIYLWKSKEGIELIHPTSTYEEYVQIKNNWMAMPNELKELSDQKSLELYGKTNIEHMNELDITMRFIYLPPLPQDFPLEQSEWYFIGESSKVLTSDEPVTPIAKNTIAITRTTYLKYRDYFNQYMPVNSGSLISPDETLIVTIQDTIPTKQVSTLGPYQIWQETVPADKLKYKREFNDILIPFADKILVIPRYPLLNSLLFSGWLKFDTTRHLMEDFESNYGYIQLLMDENISINYLRGIDAFFELFIDPITKDILNELKEPTNIKDLLLRAVEMLTTLDYRDPSSMFNYRIREYEQFNDVLYNELARQYGQYMQSRSLGVKFTINSEAIYQRIIQNPSFVTSERINPIQDLKEKTAITFAGIGGRTEESFVIDDRRFSDDNVGIISEATVDNGKVAINAQLSACPNIHNIRGTFTSADRFRKDPANVLSPTALFMPASNQDDSKRCNFINIQMSHTVPVKEKNICRVRTGYEKVIPYQVSSYYVATAKSDGYVESVDEKLQMIKVRYNDGTVDVFSYGKKNYDVSDIVITHNVIPNVTVGQKIKKRDVICYNSDFFIPDKYDSNRLATVHGTDAYVLLMEEDGTIEDSCKITKEFGKKLSIEFTVMRTVLLHKNDIVYESKKIGDRVKNTDPLMIFEEGTDFISEEIEKYDEETKILLMKMNRKLPKAKYNGTIIDIDVLYGCPLDEMSSSLRKVVDPIVERKLKRHKFAQGTEAELEHIDPSPLEIKEGLKYKGIEFSEDVVVIVYYISNLTEHTAGDKLVIGNQLKSTTMGVLTDVPFTKSGVPIDIIFSSDRIAARVVLSPYIVGTTTRVIEALEESIISMYFNNSKK